MSAITFCVVLALLGVIGEHAALVRHPRIARYCRELAVGSAVASTVLAGLQIVAT